MLPFIYLMLGKRELRRRYMQLLSSERALAAFDPTTLALITSYL